MTVITVGTQGAQNRAQKVTIGKDRPLRLSEVAAWFSFSEKLAETDSGLE